MMAKSTKNSQEEKIDLRSVNNAPKKSFKLPTLKNPFKKQSDPLRDDEGKFATKATIGSGGLQKISKFNLKRAFPLLIVVTIVGGSLVYQSFAAACSITADKTTLYKGESTTIHWSSSAKPIAIGTTGYGHGTEAGALTRWSSGALYSNTTFYLTGGWDSSCKDSVTITVRERPAETPDQPAPTTTGPGTSSGPSAANIEIAKKWYQSCGGLGRQSEWEHWAAKIGSDRQAAWRQFKGAMETSPDRKCPVDDPTITTGGDAGKTTDYAKEAQNYATLSDAFLKQAKELNGETYKRSLISNPERKDLDFIADKEISLRRSITSLQMGLQLSQNWYNQAMANPSTKSQGPSIQASMATVTRNISAIGVYVTNIANDYARLKPKYEAGLAWYQHGAKQALKRQECIKDGGTPTWLGGCNGRPTGTGGGGTIPAGCPADINASSSKQCIKDLQTVLKGCGYYDGTIDGIWGSKTSTALYNWQANGKRCTERTTGTVSCPTDYVQNGSGNCSPVYRSPSGRVRCQTGYDQKDSSVSLGGGDSRYSVSEHYCTKNGLGYKDKFLSFPCPSGYSRSQRSSQLVLTTCRRD